MSTTIFNEESSAALANLRKVAQAISLAATGAAPAGLKGDDGGSFTLSRSLPDVTSAVRDVGEKLLALISKFEGAVEEQLVTFYRTMKQQVEQEHLLLRSTKSLMPSDPALLKHLKAATHEQFHQSTNSVVTPRSTHAPVSGVFTATTPNAARPTLPSLFGSPAPPQPHAAAQSRGGAAGSTCVSPTQDIPTIAIPSALVLTSSHRNSHLHHHVAPAPKDPNILASEALRMWLYVTLQSTLQLCEASRGAIYLQATEGTSYLRRVCGINADERLPLDVSPAAGSTIATVVQNNVAVNIGRSRHKNPNALDAYSTASQAVRASVAIKINTGVIIPIGDIGCVLVADKTTESYFSELDEHVVWCTATLVRGVLRRYKADMLIGKTPAAMIQALSATALLPPISADIPQLSDGTSATPSPSKSHDHHHHASNTASHKNFLSPEEELQSLLPGITRIPRLPKKLVVVRTSEVSGFQQLLAKDVDNLKKIELSDEDLLEAAVPYISNLEALWKKSIDSMTELRSTCERLDKEIARRNARIVELEVEHRILTRQLHAMKNDVQKIRSAVPTHLKELTSGGGGNVVPEAATSHALLGAMASGDTKLLMRRLPSTKQPQPPPPKRNPSSREPKKKKVPTHLKELTSGGGGGHVVPEAATSHTLLGAMASGDTKLLMRRLPSTKQPQPPPPKRNPSSREPSTAR
ncbi:Hypothetical protein, putative [Bodo saltans]|uniref:GAF domain-containing protein n=1 Tax=Bodo saltans TaxID=75058 RepID=A0A0S4IQN0_BODSA|nr:Hypothetical protein, putative [Bodo saltans]|eukprot:CUF29589.1 Hypothetical protein, putative [Bodo saltans]